MKRSARNLIISSVTFFAGLYFFLEWLLPKKLGEVIPKGVASESLREFQFGAFHEQISTGLILTGITAIGLGLINLVRVHGSVIIKNRKGKLNSFALLLGAISVFIIEGIDFTTSVEQSRETQILNQLSEYTEANTGNTEKLTLLGPELERIKHLTNDSDSLYFKPSNNLPALLKQAEQEIDNQTFKVNFNLLLESARDTWKKNRESSLSSISSDFVFSALFVPLGSAMFSLLAFYVATAAYRTFRINTLETSLMMFGAVIVILGQIPFGPLYIHEDLPIIRFRLMEYISTPASRAILFGSLIAGLAMSFRMWLSLERSPLSTEGGETKTSNSTGGKKS